MLRTPSYQRSGWVRITQLKIRCPICSRPDYCTVSADGAVCNCPRTPNDHPIYGQRRRVGRLPAPPRRGRGPGDRQRPAVARRAVHCPARPDAAPGSFGRAVPHVREPRPPRRLRPPLGLSAASLARLGCGWADGVPMWRQRHGAERPLYAWAFPMRDDLLRITGLRLRGEDDRKFSFTGGHEGLFVPENLTGDGPLLLPEGPTSCAACLDLGYEAIGRPNDAGGVRLLSALLGRRFGQSKRRRDLVVVADNDPPKHRPDGTVFYPGQDGAERVAGELAAAGWHVKVIQPTRPDTKDVRDWLRAGATRPVVDCVIRNASYVVPQGRACA
jgi:hypothetical protein